MRRRPKDQTSNQELPVFGLANIFPDDEPQTEQIEQIPASTEIITSAPEQVNGYQEVLADKAATDSFGLGYAFELPSWFHVVAPPAVAREAENRQNTLAGSIERYLDGERISRAVEDGEVKLTSISKNFKVNMPGYGVLPGGYAQDYKLDFRVKTEAGFKPGSLELRRLKFLSDDEDSQDFQYRQIYWVMQPTKESETFSLPTMPAETPKRETPQLRNPGLVLPQIRRGSEAAEAAVVTRSEKAYRAPIDEVKDLVVDKIADRFYGVERPSDTARSHRPVVDFTQGWQQAVGANTAPAPVAPAEPEPVASIATPQPQAAPKAAPEPDQPTPAAPANRQPQPAPAKPRGGEQDLGDFINAQKSAGKSGNSAESSRKSAKSKFNKKRYKFAAIAGVAIAAVGISHLAGGGSSEFSSDQIGYDLSKAELSQLISTSATAKEKKAAVNFEGALAKGDFKTVSYYQAEGKLAQEVNYKGNWFPQGTYANPSSFPALVRNFYVNVDSEFKLVTQDNPDAFGVYPSADNPKQLVVVADMSKFVTEPTAKGGLKDPDTNKPISFSPSYFDSMNNEQMKNLGQEVEKHPLYGVFSNEDASAAVSMFLNDKLGPSGALLGEYAVLSQISQNYGSDITVQAEKAVESFVAKTAKTKKQVIAKVEFINTKKRPTAEDNFTTGKNLTAYAGDTAIARLKGSTSNTRLVGTDELKLSKTK